MSIIPDMFPSLDDIVIDIDHDDHLTKPKSTPTAKTTPTNRSKTPDYGLSSQLAPEQTLNALTPEECHEIANGGGFFRTDEQSYVPVTVPDEQVPVITSIADLDDVNSIDIPDPITEDTTLLCVPTTKQFKIKKVPIEILPHPKYSIPVEWRQFYTLNYCSARKKYTETVTTTEAVKKCGCENVRCYTNTMKFLNRCGYCDKAMRSACIHDGGLLGCCRECFLRRFSFPENPLRTMTRSPQCM